MKKHKHYFLILYLLPFLWYLPLIIKVRPEFDFIYSETTGYILIGAYVLISALLTWKSKKKSHIVKKLILLSLSLIAHFFLFSYLIITSTNVYSSKQIKFKKKYTDVTIYILNKKSFDLFKPNTPAEIGYSFKNSPVYHTYYQTNKYLKFQSDSNNIISIVEYNLELTLPKEKTAVSSILKTEREYTNTDTIKIDLKRIK